MAYWLQMMCSLRARECHGCCPLSYGYLATSRTLHRSQRQAESIKILDTKFKIWFEIRNTNAVSIPICLEVFRVWERDRDLETKRAAPSSHETSRDPTSASTTPLQLESGKDSVRVCSFLRAWQVLICLELRRRRRGNTTMSWGLEIWVCFGARMHAGSRRVMNLLGSGF